MTSLFTHRKMFFCVVSIFLLLLTVLFVCSSSATDYYVDPVQGSDDNVGVLDKPFKTIKYSLLKLQSGDTLFLRGGRYFEHDLSIAVTGLPAATVTIKNYPGETPIIDGSLDYFRTSGNADWLPVDEGRGIFKSAKTFDNLSLVEGYFKNGSRYYKLVNYTLKEHLFSDNYNYSQSGYYVGPGIFWDSADARIYIRLQQADSQAIDHVATIPTVTDPRLLQIYLCGKNYGFIVSGASHMSLEGVQIVYCFNSIRITSGHDLVFKNLYSQPGKYSFVVDENVENMVLDSITFNNFHPDWVAWVDVKVGPKPAYSFQDHAFEARKGCSNIEIVGCTFKNLLDGIDIIEAVSKLHIHDNYFENIKDDCIQLGSATYDVEINNNIMVDVFTGISRHGSGVPSRPGTKYIHHNVIDCRKRVLVGRKDPGSLLKYDSFWFDGSPWGYHNPIGSHNYSGIGNDPWKMYNNTFFFGQARNHYGCGHTILYDRPDPSYKQEVYNNIFYQIHDGEIARGANLTNRCEIYDGNLYYKENNSVEEPMFYLYKIDGQEMNFATLSEFISSEVFEVTRAYYTPGWEKNSIYADPKLDANFKPTNGSLALSGAISLPESWPGSSGVKYRGAFAGTGARLSAPTLHKPK